MLDLSNSLSILSGTKRANESRWVPMSVRSSLSASFILEYPPIRRSISTIQDSQAIRPLKSMTLILSASRATVVCGRDSWLETHSAIGKAARRRLPSSMSRIPPRFEGEASFRKLLRSAKVMSAPNTPWAKEREAVIPGALRE
jgi:hypothetical protein